MEIIQTKQKIPDQPMNDALTSPHSRKNKLARVCWWLVWVLLYRWSPRPFHVWRRFLLRLFGAKMGRGSHPYPSCRIWAPWNLEMHEHSCLGDRVDCYSVDRIVIGAYAVVSQDSCLCAATHDFRAASFRLVTKPIEIGRHAWVAAGAFVAPGVRVGDGAVVGARSVVTRNVPPWTVVAGNPARQVSTRPQIASPEEEKTPQQPTIVIISQVYVPDPASLGQHMHDAAAELVRRGFRVVVLTSRAGYEDPKERYAKREVRDAVEIRRLSWSNFGKRSIPFRLLGAASFLLQAILRTVFMRQVDGLLVSTSPPMGSFAALVIAAIRRVPIVYWAMDINPDQAVALGRFRAGSMPVRWLDRLNRAILRKAERIITLDRFMAERLRRKQDCGERMAVIPPWPLDETFQPVAHVDNRFRREHGLDGKFVVMYSGNMSIAHPLETVLQAADQLRHRDDVVFLFVGGGLARRDVERCVQEHGATNIRLLPYQPREFLQQSLAAADVHVISMGDDMVGIVHPCKIYGAMACGRPVLLVGPCASHAGELIDHHEIGWQIDHGNVSGFVRLIENILADGTSQLAEMGLRAQAAIDRAMSKSALCGAVCDEIELAMAHGRFFGVSAEPAEAAAELLPVGEPAREAEEVGGRPAPT